MTRSFWGPAFSAHGPTHADNEARIHRETGRILLALLAPLLLLLLACAPEPVEAPAADTGVSERRCGRPRCASVTETCYGGPGLVCVCTTLTCVDRCGTVVVEGKPVCATPEPIPLEVPRG